MRIRVYKGKLRVSGNEAYGILLDDGEQRVRLIASLQDIRDLRDTCNKIIEDSSTQQLGISCLICRKRDPTPEEREHWFLSGQFSVCEDCAAIHPEELK